MSNTLTLDQSQLAGLPIESQQRIAAALRQAVNAEKQTLEQLAADELKSAEFAAEERARVGAAAAENIERLTQAATDYGAWIAAVQEQSNALMILLSQAPVKRGAVERAISATADHLSHPDTDITPAFCQIDGRGNVTLDADAIAEFIGGELLAPLHDRNGTRIPQELIELFRWVGIGTAGSQSGQQIAAAVAATVKRRVLYAHRQRTAQKPARDQIIEILSARGARTSEKLTA